MKLNLDCVRDVLIVLEDTENMDNTGNLELIEINDIENALPDYERKELLYTLRHLIEEHYINGEIISSCGEPDIYEIDDLSWKGHELLKNIRNKPVWEKVKQKALSHVGTVSISVLSALAESIIRNQLGI